MIRFAWPWMAALLPLPYLHYRWRRAAAPGGAALFLPFAAALFEGSAAAWKPKGPWRSLVFAALWVLLLAAAMRPQWLGDPLPAPTTGRRIILAVDVSGSMSTPDMANNESRLQVVQQVAGQFIEGRHGDQVGLILFGTQPYVQAPLTPDLDTVHRFLDEAVVGVAGRETAIGDAIGMAIKRLRAERASDAAASGTAASDAAGSDAAGSDAAVAAPDAQRRAAEHSAADRTVLILLTDGQSNAGAIQPLQAARFAAQTGLRIYTIGVGAAAQPGFFGFAGNNDLDEGTLKEIAKITGGRYFRATDADALQAVYQQIDRLEPVAGREQWLRPTDEWFFYPLGLALLLSLPAALLGARAWR